MSTAAELGALIGPFGEGLASEILACYDAMAERLGLNQTDLRCLELIARGSGITPGRLAERTGLTSGAVTGIVDRLEAGGFTERRSDPSDRRSVTVRLVPDAADDLRAALEPLRSAMASVLGQYPVGERDAITDFLARATEAMTAETDRLRALSRGGFINDVYTAPLGGATRGRLVFRTGAPRVSLNVAPLGPSASARIIMETSASRLSFVGTSAASELIRATFDGPLPDVRVAAGLVTIRYPRRPFSTRTARIALNGSIPWTIEIDGGITDLAGTMSGVQLAGLSLHGGGNHISLDLPAPSGTVAVRVDGVASRAVFRRSGSVPAALRVKGGVSHLRFDGQRRASVSGERRYVSDAWSTTPDRYEIEVLGGASTVRVERR